MLHQNAEYAKIKNGGVGEGLNPAVLKTVRPERVSGVRIPPPPPYSHQIIFSEVLSESKANFAAQHGPQEPQSSKNPWDWQKKSPAHGKALSSIGEIECTITGARSFLKYSISLVRVGPRFDANVPAATVAVRRS